MHKVSLGKNGPQLPRIGYGAMVLEGYYGMAAENEALDVLNHAMDLGLMIDTADAYGGGHNEELIQKALHTRDDEPFIASKFGIVFDEKISSTALHTSWGFSLGINANPDYAEQCLNASLQRLNKQTLDLWYLHYPDPSIPIEESVGAMARPVEQGKVRYLGLSNVNAEQVRRAHEVHPIHAVQIEYSLWRREAEQQLLPTLRELGIALVAWSPLGSGFFAGNPQNPDDNDFRKNNPKYSGENFDHNKKQLQELNTIAQKNDLTLAQLSLAWLLAQGDDIFPIPGTRKPERITENLHAAMISLDQDTLKTIDTLTKPGSFSGKALLD